MCSASKIPLISLGALWVFPVVVTNLGCGYLGTMLMFLNCFSVSSPGLHQEAEEKRYQLSPRAILQMLLPLSLGKPNHGAKWERCRMVLGCVTHVESSFKGLFNLLEWALGNAFKVVLRAKIKKDTSYILDNNMLVF